MQNALPDPYSEYFWCSALSFERNVSRPHLPTMGEMKKEKNTLMV